MVRRGTHPTELPPAAVEALRSAMRREMEHHPFSIDGVVILPDHLHTIWTLPPEDSRFSIRWTKIKGDFTRAFLSDGGHEGPRNPSRAARGERGVWQRRFWDHVVRDDDEYAALMDYIHWNPVKHGYVRCPHEWPLSSFHERARQGSYATDWMCQCGGTRPRPPAFDRIEGFAGE